MQRGLVLINTGKGKGKTTAALGVALRAYGNGQKVLILQFIKGIWKYGELRAIEKLGEGIEIRQLGEGFVRHNKDANESELQRHRQVAVKAWGKVEKEVYSDEWDLIVLDEINYAISFGLIDEDLVIELIKKKPDRLNIVLTGRDASEKLIELADTVTEMTSVKHAYQSGIKARVGIEY